MGYIAAIVIVIILGLFLQYWYIFGFIFLMAVLVYQYNQRLILPKKIALIKRNNLVLIIADEIQYGIPIKVERINEEIKIPHSFNKYEVSVNTTKVFMVTPILTVNGNVEILTSEHDINSVNVPDYEFIKKYKKLRYINEITYIIKECLLIEAETANFERNYLEITEMSTLISADDPNQIDIYTKALIQIEKLLIKCKELKTFYLHIVKEILIRSSDPHSYSLDSNLDKIADIQWQYRQLQTEYQNIKQETEIYFTLNDS